MQKILHTPEGVRDIYNGECAVKKITQQKILDVFHSYGYEDIETPMLEYFEVFSNEVGTVPSRELYKLFDREGNTIVIRPDFTPSIARVCSTYFDPSREILTFCYTGKTLVNSSSLRGNQKESTQMGIERIGDDSPEADAEVLAMTIESMRSCGIKDFQVSVGQVDYFKAALSEADLCRENEETLRALISEKNYFAVENFVKEINMDPALGKLFSALPQLFGGADILKKARELSVNDRCTRAVDRLEEIYEILGLYGLQKYISFDFGMVSKIRYYTGIIFRAFTYGTGEPIIKGGRYDELLKEFGTSAPAVGFVIVIDTLMNALTRQKLLPKVPPSPTVITYNKTNRNEAIAKAGKLRARGERVFLRPEVQ